MTEEEIVDLETINDVLSDDEESKIDSINKRIAKEEVLLEKIDTTIAAIENKNSLSGIDKIMKDTEIVKLLEKLKGKK